MKNDSIENNALLFGQKKVRPQTTKQMCIFCLKMHTLHEQHILGLRVASNQKRASSILGGVYLIQKGPNQGDLGSKNGIKKCSQNLSFGGVHFMKKIQNLYLTPLLTCLFGGTLAPQGDLGSKKLHKPKVLRIKFQGGPKMPKIRNTKFF